MTELGLKMDFHNRNIMVEKISAAITEESGDCNLSPMVSTLVVMLLSIISLDHIIFRIYID